MAAPPQGNRGSFPPANYPATASQQQPAVLVRSSHLEPWSLWSKAENEEWNRRFNELMAQAAAREQQTAGLEFAQQAHAPIEKAPPKRGITDQELHLQAQKAGKDAHRRCLDGALSSSPAMSPPLQGQTPELIQEGPRNIGTVAVSHQERVVVIGAWPRMMTIQTLAKYLDMGSPQTVQRRAIADPSFPAKDPRTGRWDKEAVDRWVSERKNNVPSVGGNWREEQRAWVESR